MCQQGWKQLSKFQIDIDIDFEEWSFMIVSYTFFVGDSYQLESSELLISASYFSHKSLFMFSLSSEVNRKRENDIISFSVLNNGW